MPRNAPKSSTDSSHDSMMRCCSCCSGRQTIDLQTERHCSCVQYPSPKRESFRGNTAVTFDNVDILHSCKKVTILSIDFLSILYDNAKWPGPHGRDPDKLCMQLLFTEVFYEPRHPCPGRTHYFAILKLTA